MTATDRDAMGARLAGLAWELASRVRTDDPAAVRAWVMRQVPVGELVSFAVLLAAHVPIDGDQAALLAWWLDPEPAASGPVFVEPVELPTDSSSHTDEELHNAFVRARARGVPVDEIDDEVRVGRDRFLAGQRRSA